LRMFWLMDARSHFGVLEDFAAACQPRSLSSRFVLMFRPAMTWPPKFVLLRFIELCKPEV
jgi:hypothetical protein